MYQDLVIFQKTYDLALWIYPKINKFPKQQRFVLGQRLENTVVRIIELVLESNSPDYNKSYSLRKIDTELDKLRIFVRLSKDLNFLSTKSYLFVAEKINEIGKLLGGLKKL